MADKLHVVQVHRQERRPPPRQDGDLHAQAALRRQRLAACTCHQSLWKDGKPLFAGNGYAGLSEMALLLHRRHPQARPGALRLHATRRPTSYKRLVPGLRGAGQPGLLEPQPLGRRSASRCTRRARRPSASSSARPDPSLQPLPGLRRHADGRPRRHPEQDRPGRAARQGHLRPAARGAGKDVPTMPGSLDEALDALEERPRVPAQGRRLHRGRDRDLDRVQDGRTRSTRCACARTPTSSRSTSTA